MSADGDFYPGTHEPHEKRTGTSAIDFSPPVLVRKPLAQILTFWNPGSYDWGWAEEYEDVMIHERTDAIRKRVESEGIGFQDHIAPVLLGSDWRVWDGHHRICLAIQLDIPYLNVEVA